MFWNKQAKKEDEHFNNQISLLNQLLNNLADGNYSINSPFSVDDPFFEVGQTINRLSKNLKNISLEFNTLNSCIKNKDIKKRADNSNYKGVFSDLVKNVNEIADILTEKDIDELEDRLELSESLKRGISDPFFTVNEDLTITYMNDACAAATGYSIKETVGKLTCREVFKSDICDTGCAIKHCMKTGENIEGKKVIITNRNGVKIPIVASAAALRDTKGKVLGGFEICRDITKDLEAEIKINDQLELTQSLRNGISDPFFMVDTNLIITYMNKACAEATGFSIEESVGKLTCKEVFKSDICETSCAIKNCMKTGENIVGKKVIITNSSFANLNLRNISFG